MLKARVVVVHFGAAADEEAAEPFGVKDRLQAEKVQEGAPVLPVVEDLDVAGLLMTDRVLETVHRLRVRLLSLEEAAGDKRGLSYGDEMVMRW